MDDDGGCGDADDGGGGGDDDRDGTDCDDG